MVIRLLTGKDVAGSVRYNEQKVGEGQAERILIANYPDRNVAEKSARFRLQLLEQQARLNPAIGKPAVHLAIAFHPTESLTDDQLRQVGREVMTEAGYGRQPYLIFRHDDTSHPHIHIVSVSVDPDGRKISDQFIQRRLNRIRQEVEQRHGLIQAERIGRQNRIAQVGETVTAEKENSRQPLGEIIERSLTAYSFGSVDSFRQYLSLNGVRMKTSAGRSKTGITFQLSVGEMPGTPPVRASSLATQPTQKRLTDRFAAQAAQHQKGRDDLATVIGQRLSRYDTLTEADFKNELRQVGIQVQEQAGAYLYIQERAGLVVAEEELPPACRQQTLRSQFSERTCRRVVQPTNPVKPQPVMRLPVLPAQPLPVRPGTDALNRDLATPEQVNQRPSPGAKPPSLPADSNDKNDQHAVDQEPVPLRGTNLTEEERRSGPDKKATRQKKNRRRHGPRL